MAADVPLMNPRTATDSRAAETYWECENKFVTLRQQNSITFKQ